MYVRTLSKDLQRKAEDELNEVPTRVQDDIKHIKEWLSQQPHLNVEADDQWILSFLRGCKFSLQKTKEKLDLYYTMRTLLPEFYSNRDPMLPEIQEVLTLGLLLPLQKTAQTDGPRIILSRCDNTDPLKIPFVPVVKIYLMILDILLKEDDNFIVAGQQVLVDMRGFTLKHALAISPSVLKKMVICLQDAQPTRPKGFHLVNMPSFAETLFGVVKQFMFDKHRNKFHFYSDETLKDIYKFIPHSVLPSELGGAGDSFNELTAYWKQKVESYREWFLKEANYSSNENVRPGKPKTCNDAFGLDGSFRKLNID